MLNLVKLKTFQELATTKNFTRAAAKLGYSQSSVTIHIQGLERELGATLFERDSRSVILTECGRRMLEYTNRLLALASEAELAIRTPEEAMTSLVPASGNPMEFGGA